MSVMGKLDERRTAVNGSGDKTNLSIRGDFAIVSKAHADKIKAKAQECLDIMEEVVTGAMPLPYGEKKKPVPVAKGQRKLAVVARPKTDSTPS